MRIIRWVSRPRGWRWLVAGLAASLLAGELGLRVGLGRALRTRAFPTIYTADPVIGYRYAPSSRGRLCIPDLCRDVAINGQGLYGSTFAEPKGDRYRVAVVSDSDATGIWTDDGDSYVSLLGAHLSALSSHIEVVNFSIDGMDRDVENLAWAREIVARYAPDLVMLHTRIPFISSHAQREDYRGYVLSYASGSPSAREKAHASIDYIEARSVAKSLYDASYIARFASREYFTHASGAAALLIQTYVNRRYAVGTPALPESALASTRSLLEARDAFWKAGVRLLLIGPEDDPHLAQTATQAGLDFAVYRQPSGGEFQLRTNTHLTHRAHQLIANQLGEALQSRLERWGVLSPKVPGVGGTSP